MYALAAFRSVYPIGVVMSGSHRITPDDLNLVNRTVWAVRTKMSELSKMYGMRDTDFLSKTPDPTGLFWMGEVRELVIKTLESEMSEMRDVWNLYQRGGFMSLWYESYRKVVTWTVYGALCREAAMSESRGSSESYYWADLALRYEMSVLDDFSRWSEMTRLGEMENFSVLSDPPELSAMAE